MAEDQDRPQTEGLPEGHVMDRDQAGGPQSLQGMWDVKGNAYPVVISTGFSITDEVERERALLANPPQTVIPAQDPTPVKAGDELPLNPATGELSFQGGPSKILSPVMEVHEGTEESGGQAVQVVGSGEDLGVVADAPQVNDVTASGTGDPDQPRKTSATERRGGRNSGPGE